MSSPLLIAVDWGTTAMRTVLLAADGRVVAHRDGSMGITSVQAGAQAAVLPLDQAFRTILAMETESWRKASLTPLDIVISGMAGSRQGWIEAPYLNAPATAVDFSGALVAHDTGLGGTCRFVPGLATRTADGVPDVMRGEETQIFGALDAMGLSEGQFVLPGTHSKWVTVVAGAIQSFATSMTGEVFAALRRHTILARLMPEAAPHDPDAFARGVALGGADGPPGALLQRIFSARTLGLFDMLPASGLESYLSGLLIGAELAATAGDATAPLIVIGSDALTARYCTAAAHLGRAATAAPSDCAARGAFALYRAAQRLNAE